MTDDVLYLDVDDVLRLHARIFDIDATAARDRLRDARALESALARPINHASYEDADIAMQAAILAHGIAQSQSFPRDRVAARATRNPLPPGRREARPGSAAR